MRPNKALQIIVEGRVSHQKEMIAGLATELAQVAQLTNVSEDERDDALRFINHEITNAIERLYHLNGQLEQFTSVSLWGRFVAMIKHDRGNKEVVH